jgi:phage regulator Rha-like protein
MEVVHFIYNEQPIDFLPSGNDNLMVNATQMAKIIGKRVDHFLKSDHANEFINALELTPFGVSLTLLKREEIIKTVNGVNTWMHRVLALKFAAWLDPKFEVWVFSTIDEILLGHYKEQKEATEAKLRAEREVEVKKQELLEKYPEFVDFLALEGKVNEAEKRRIKAIRDSVKQLKLDLFL